MPPFTVESFEKAGTKVSAADMKGKVMLLDFWATWCGPCRDSMPDLQRLHDTYHAQGLEVMGITDEDRATVAKFRKDSSFTYPLYLDSGSVEQARFGIESYPTTIVVGKDGKIVFRDTGYAPGESGPLEAAVKAALGP